MPRRVARWLDDEAAHAAPLQAALEYAAWATLSPAGPAPSTGAACCSGCRTGSTCTISCRSRPSSATASRCCACPSTSGGARDGFALTDAGTDLAGALDQANYCIWCHNQGKDSCSHGPASEKDGGFQKSVFGVTLAGCPLDEKISEMNLVASRGYSLGALAIVAVDNPMCAATGHRICNDCMKACIYQRQEPVDIPQIETRTLKDVLALPWGFEIYGLLTRWNPLDLRRPLPKPPSGYKVLVVGLGPGRVHAGAPPDQRRPFRRRDRRAEDRAAAAGDLRRRRDRRARRRSSRSATSPSLYERLDERVMAGFGGVAEYGITVRWDKNFLKIDPPAARAPRGSSRCTAACASAAR